MDNGTLVYCKEDLPYSYKGKKSIVKSGETLVIKARFGDNTYVLDRWGKIFIVQGDKIEKKAR